MNGRIRQAAMSSFYRCGSRVNVMRQLFSAQWPALEIINNRCLAYACDAATKDMPELEATQ